MTEPREPSRFSAADKFYTLTSWLPLAAFLWMSSQTQTQATADPWLWENKRELGLIIFVGSAIWLIVGGVLTTAAFQQKRRLASLVLLLATLASVAPLAVILILVLSR